MKREYLISIYVIVAFCCLYYIYTNVSWATAGIPLDYMISKDRFINNPYPNERRSINIITDFTSCPVCLAEIDEFYKVSNKVDSNIIFNVILLDASEEETAFFQKSMRKGIKIKSVYADEIEMSWFNYGDTTYYAQVLFNINNEIVYRAKLESSILTSKKSKEKIINLFNKKL